MPSKTVRDIPFSVIEQSFKLASYHFGATWCPAVVRQRGSGDAAGYQIRVEVSQRGDLTKFDYFNLDADGTVLVAPRGYAREYKPGRVTGLDDAVEKYADDPQARRFVIPGGAE